MSFEPIPGNHYKIMSIYSGKLLTRGNDSQIVQEAPKEADPYETQRWFFNKVSDHEYQIKSALQTLNLVIKAPNSVNKVLTFGTPTSNDNEIWKIAEYSDMGLHIESKPYNYSHVIAFENDSMSSPIVLKDRESFHTHMWHIYRYE